MAVARKGGWGEDIMPLGRRQAGGRSEERKGETRQDDVGHEEDQEEKVKRENNVEKMRAGCGKTGHAHE